MGYTREQVEAAVKAKGYVYFEDTNNKGFDVNIIGVRNPKNTSPEKFEDEIAYFNKSKDSISYKDSSRKNEAYNFKKMSDLLIFPITYAFDDKGNYTMNFPMMDIVKGKYQIIYSI